MVATNFYDRALAEAVDRGAYPDLYRLLEAVGVVGDRGPGVDSSDRVAETVLEAATADRVRAVYREGTLAGLGTLAGRVFRCRLRDSASQLAVRALSRTPVRELSGDRGGL